MFRHLGFAYLPFCLLPMISLNEARKERHIVVVVTIISFDSTNVIIIK